MSVQSVAETKWMRSRHLRPGRRHYGATPRGDAATELDDWWRDFEIIQEAGAETSPSVDPDQPIGGPEASVTRHAIRKLSEWTRTDDEIKPRPETVAQALRWVEELRSGASRENVVWREPSVTASESGEIVLEWRCENRRLTLYLLLGSGECIRSWGPSIRDEMREEACASASVVLRSLRWLRSPEAAGPS